MPYYKYKARNLTGESTTGVLLADSEAELERQLSDEEKFLISVAAVSESQSGKSSAISRKELIALTSQLAVVAGSGIAILEGLEDISGQAESSGLKQAVDGLVMELNRGKSLSEAMAANPRVFGALYVNTLKAGEATGDLVHPLERLVSHLEWEEEISSKIKQAAAYPVILVCMLGSVMAVLVGFVLPRFAAIFMKKGYPLPFPTNVLIAGSSFARAHWIEIVVCGLLSFGLLRLMARTSRGKSAIDRIKFGLPVFGSLARGIAVSRFSHTLATTVGSGIDIISAITMSGLATGNTFFAGVTDRVAKSVSEGNDLAASFRETGMFPPLFVRMAGVGERTGALALMLDKASGFYDREIRVGIARLMPLCEAAVTVAMGFAVTLVALSVFLPLYKMLDLVKR